MDFGYDEEEITAMHSEVLSATKKWFEIVQMQMPPTKYERNGNTIPYNFANTRSCRYFGDSMPALLKAGVKTNRVNEDEGEKNQMIPKMLAKRHTMKGRLVAKQTLQKAEESSRVRSQILEGFERELARNAKAEASEREKMKPHELRRQVLDVVNRPIEVIMKEGTSRDFDVGTFVPSNAFALDAELENEAEYMDQLEDSDYPDALENGESAGINAAGVPVDLDANNEADAVETGEDGDVNSAGDDAEPPIQLDFSEEELQAEEELPIEHDQT